MGNDILDFSNIEKTGTTYSAIPVKGGTLTQSKSKVKTPRADHVPGLEVKKKKRPPALILQKDKKIKELVNTACKMSAEGAISIENIGKLITDSGYNLSRNKVLMREECNGRPSNDALRGEIISRMRELGEYTQLPPIMKTLGNRHIIDAAITCLYHKNEYDPIRKYLEGLTYDLQPGEEEPFSALCDAIADKDKVFPVFMKRFLLGCVARIFDFTPFQNHTLVLKGDQGIGKSTLCSWLCSGLGKEYFQEGFLMPEDKDHKLRLVKKFIWAVDEFGESNSRVSQNALKAFLTQESVSERPPYARNEIMMPRQCNIIATTNDDTFLTDPTGNRRYLVVDLSSIDHRYYNTVSADMLWAQVMTWYKNKARPELNAKEKEIQKSINQRFEDVNVVEEYLKEILVFDPKSRIKQRHLNQSVFGHFHQDSNPFQMNTIARQVTKIMSNKFKTRMVKTEGYPCFVGVRYKVEQPS